MNGDWSLAFMKVTTKDEVHIYKLANFDLEINHRIIIGKKNLSTILFTDKNLK